MNCQAKSLEEVVQPNKGRASELVQAKKSSSHQAELSRHLTHSTLRQIEFRRLRKLVGNGLPPVQGMAFSYPEPLAFLIARARQSAEIRQLDAQADTGMQYVQALEASKKPQVSWNMGGQTAQGFGGNLNR